MKDVIDMGCMQNEKKGIMTKELFKIPTVDSGEANLCAIREHLPKKKMFSSGHCPNEGGGGPCPN